MKIILSCTEEQKEELTRTGISPGAEIIYANGNNAEIQAADAFIDLQFENTPAYFERLAKIPARVIIVNSVVSTLAEIHRSFVRINAWPTFLSSNLVEASCLDGDKREAAEAAFSIFNKKIEWVPDEAGFITARIISMIINEAFFALSEGVSTRQEMDTAMKLGTNYPYGPFEWAEKIELKNIASLLASLSKQQNRYAPCHLLLEECSRSSILHSSA